ncbi:MAG TPA: DUF805 domain-containing protein [Gammaproteobacteria bacterium]|nr:DUF805 domain-containing protein [Gammaproteobacteria bacterium]
MNFDTLFVYASGRTPRGQYIGALVTLLVSLGFYYFLVPGRNSQWVQLVFLYPAVVLLARRLHDMGRAAWPLIVPAALVIVMAYLYLYVPASGAKSGVKWAAIVVSAAFMVWGLVGKTQAEPNRFGAPAA